MVKYFHIATRMFLAGTLQNVKYFTLNRFLVNVPILYSLKTPENFRLSGVSRGYKMETLTRNGLSLFLLILFYYISYTKWA